MGKKQKVKFDENGEPLLPVDWKRTIELHKKHPEYREEGRMIYHTNDHSNNVRYKLFWSKNGMVVKNKELYSLRFTKPNKRRTACLIREGKEFYIKE